MRLDRSIVQNASGDLQIFYLIALIELHELLELSTSVFRLQHARANITGEQKKECNKAYMSARTTLHFCCPSAEPCADVLHKPRGAAQILVPVQVAQWHNVQQLHEVDDGTRHLENGGGHWSDVRVMS